MAEENDKTVATNDLLRMSTNNTLKLLKKEK